MNDLKLLYSRETKFNLQHQIEMIAFDTNMSIIYLTDHSKIYQIFETELTEVFDLFNISDNVQNKLVLFQFLTESNNISTISTNGDINLINVLNKTSEGVGSIFDGILGAQWSPDQELLAILTTSNALILMTKDYDIVNEQKISTDNVVESIFVNVGWGSFETQFKGSEGKHATKLKIDDNLLDWDDKKANICWRSDGEYFVVHFVETSKNSRRFQVFNREGVLHSNIEDHINVLDNQIAWKYSKSLITASIQRLNKHEIIFFERNGLSHGSFTLPFTYGQMKVNGIYWNLDSTVLCVWSELVNKNEKSTSIFQSVVQLWTTSNYHWYLKQSYNFCLENKVTIVSWDPEDSYKLHLITSSGQYINYKLAWIVNYSKHVCDDYNGSIAVIDSYNALITPFKNKIIPPPMSLHKLTCPKPINKLVWSSFNMDIISHLMSNELLFYKLVLVNDEIQNGLKLGTYNYELYAQIEVGLKDMNEHNSSIQHILWNDKHRLVLIVTKNDSYFYLMELLINESRDGKFSLEEKFQMRLDFEVLNVDFNPTTKHLAIQSSSGNIFKYANAADFTWELINDDFKFPHPCANFSLTSIQKSEREIYVGLSQLYRLYADKLEVANNCSSYYIHDRFLLFTDHTNHLKFIELTKQSLANKKIQEESLRKVERGAKVLIALHTDTGCLLQMPRGNIELIHPRTLLISKLKSDIDDLNYFKAVEMMRKHRVNMNILFDHNPQNFLNNCHEFVKQVNSPNLINLFLTELNDEDTTTTFYKDHYLEKYATKNTTSKVVDSSKNKNKITDICTKLIEICETIDSSKYFLVILSCYAKMQELEKALHRIVKTRNDSQSMVDEGLRHLLYIVDVNQLFDVALGTYDFEVVLMVAEKSQKDPKEYLPFLNDLKKLEENYRKYKIDLYLKRHKKALQSIVKCQERESELLNLVDNQKLYSEALKYYKPTDKLFKEISKLFSSHLNEKKYYDEAGLVLFRAELYEESLDCFLKSTNWQMFINVCKRLKLSPNIYFEKLKLILEKLKAENKYLDCSNIYENFLNDSENAIVNLISGLHWFEAINLIHKSNRFDFVETNLLPSLKSSKNDIINSLDTYEKKLIDNKSRLDQVREEKIKKREKELLDELDDDFRNNDDMSVSEMSQSTIDNESTTGSVKSSTSTIASTASTKSKRRKQKRSAITLKKGSAFEDLALIQELSDTISYVYSMKDGVFNLSRALMLYNMNDLCVEIQKKYEMVVDFIENNKNLIWNYPIVDQENKLNREFVQTNCLLADLTDFSKLDVKYRFPPEAINKRSWKLHYYE